MLAALCSNILNGIDYPRAFKQDELYKEFPHLMEHWGCQENIAHQQETYPYELNTDYASKAPSSLGSVYSKAKYVCSRGIKQLTRKRSQEIDYQALEKQYQHKCLEKLFAEKRWNIMAPAREGLLQFAVVSMGSYLTTKVAGANSFGGSFSQFVAATNTASVLGNVFEVGCKLLWPPITELDALEMRYAVNKCFIPNTLWPKIEEMFLMARSNSFESRNCINFIEFALGLTVYKPKNKLSAILISDEINQELDRRIDNFFSNYDTTSIDLELFKLKSGIHDFVKRLVDNAETTPKYIYLHGKGGVGKTYFVQQLCTWINDLLPQGVYFEDLSIDDAQDLEGNPQKPGILLKILRNQLQSGKHGSVVFVDEASWLNDYPMISIAKRVFNGDLTKISTHYFGSGIGGSALSLVMPPTLIFVANNNEITDKNLQSRFITITFPNPIQDALVRYAHKIFEESDVYNKAVALNKDQEICTKLYEIIIKPDQSTYCLDTFRAIEQFIKPFVLKELA